MQCFLYFRPGSFRFPSPHTDPTRVARHDAPRVLGDDARHIVLIPPPLSPPLDPGCGPLCIWIWISLLWSARYTDIGVVLQPGPASQAWEGLQGTDSISPPFLLPDNTTWAAFYGSAQTQKAGRSPHALGWCVTFGII